MVEWQKFDDSQSEWNSLLAEMPFFSIYQSYEWGEIKKNDGWKIIRLVDQNKKSMAQILYKKLPFNIFFFWCPGGVLGEELEVDFRYLKRELKFSFYYFRVSFHDFKLALDKIFKSNYTKPTYSLNSNQCMILNLSPSSEELLMAMSSNWRHNLKRFEKKKINVERWDRPNALELYEYYNKFEKMKGLSRQHSLNSIQGVIEKFQERLVILKASNENGELLALRGYLYMGDRALDWYAITTDLGRVFYASNGVCWLTLLDAKARGIKVYDFSGVDPVNNVGVYNFKKGTGAKLVNYPGEYETSSVNLVNFLINLLMKYKMKSDSN
jgi:lipid II:glycine glycyltransferase (peptidoglycan interpeptide bridge formation enzyme)